MKQQWLGSSGSICLFSLFYIIAKWKKIGLDKHDVSKHQKMLLEIVI